MDKSVHRSFVLPLMLCVVFVAVAHARQPATSGTDFAKEIKPIVAKYCVECHGPDDQNGELRIDTLDPDLVDGPDARKWHGMLDALNLGKMPPQDASQPTASERSVLVNSLTNALQRAAESARKEISTTIRRLNGRQYNNTLQDLLGINLVFAANLPGDGLSPEGFRNNGDTLNMSQLRMEHYMTAARAALGKAIFTDDHPTIHHFLVELGKDINPNINPKQEPVALGYIADPIKPEDYRYSEPALQKPFEHTLYRRRTHYIFDEGYRGNATVRGEKEFTDIFHSVFVDMRRSNGRHCVQADGIELEPATVSAVDDIRSPTMKVVIREYPMEGDFVVRVKASKIPRPFLRYLGADKPSLSGYDPGAKVCANPRSIAIEAVPPTESEFVEITDVVGNTALRKDGVNRSKVSRANWTFDLSKPGVYQLEAVYAWSGQIRPVDLTIDDHLVMHAMRTPNRKDDPQYRAHSCLIGHLSKGPHTIGVSATQEMPNIVRFLLTPVPGDSTILADYKTRDGNNPNMIAYMGARRDDGEAYATVGDPLPVSSTQPKVYKYKGRFEEMVLPSYEEHNRNYLANLLHIGVWIESRDVGSRFGVKVHSIEFEGPYFETWPPQSHQRVFIDSPNRNQPEVYAREVLEHFMRRAYRRPLEEGELDLALRFWKELHEQYPDFDESIRETLVIILSSPQFLYIHEPNLEGPRPLNEFELAVRLSYFLWDTMPDVELFEIAKRGKLRQNLIAQVQRMIKHRKSWKFVTQFTDQWLDVSRMDRIVVIGRDEYTPEIRELAKQETYHYFNEILQCNGSILEFIDSDFSMLNERLAEFYGIDGVRGKRFRRVAIDADGHRGGVLTHSSILTGHSSGRDSHPVKRGVWLTKKLLDNPPPAAPPNVPALEKQGPEFARLPIARQLDLHRNNVACNNCHKRIDPWGLAFEKYDTIGLYRESPEYDASADLPDGSEVKGLDDLKTYILDRKRDAVCRSVVKHLTSYALGRSLTFADAGRIDEIVAGVKDSDYGLQTVILAITQDSLFTSR